MVRGVLVPLSPEDEIALRRLAASAREGALGMTARMTERLRQLGLAERVAGAWRLTPLGKRRLSGLPKPPLQTRAKPVIDSILDRYIPLALARGIARPEQTPEEQSGRPPRILLAEDCYLEADALSRLLRESGFEVVGPVARFDQAMSLARGQSLDAALLDIDLDGEKSFAVASTLHRRSVPVAFVSGHAPTIVPPAVELQAMPFVAKPFVNEDLVTVVKSLAQSQA